MEGLFQETSSSEEVFEDASISPRLHEQGDAEEEEERPRHSSDAGKGRRILVLGANGYIGRHIVKYLKRRGHYVRALVRGDESRMGLFAKYCDEIVVGEVSNRDIHSELLDNVDVVISSIGTQSLTKERCWADDYQANMDFVNSAQESTLEHFLFLAHLEGHAFAKHNSLAKARERVVDTLKESSACTDMQYTIIRLSALFRDLTEILLGAKAGHIYSCPENWKVNPISVADLARVVCKAVERPSKFQSKTVSVGGPQQLTINEITSKAISTLKLKKIPKRVAPAGTPSTCLNFLFMRLRSCPSLTAKAYGKHTIGEYFTDISQGVPVDALGFRKVIVHSRKDFEVAFNIDKRAHHTGDKYTKGVLQWEFFTAERDIGFSLSLKSDESVKELIPFTREQSHLGHITGERASPEFGTFLFKWDNTYSTFRKKVLFYCIKVVKAPQEPKE